MDLQLDTVRTVSSSGSFTASAYTVSASGLSCGTTYHYQAFATNVGGTGTSSDLTFATLACPTAKTVLGVSGGIGAYGLRQLVSTYTGPLVRIRRTDGGEADVSPDESGNFSGTSPVTVISGGSGASTLSGFIASTNAFVEIWYDQVGSANVIQNTTSAQPQIVSSGSIITSGTNSQPSIQFNGTSTFLSSTSSIFTSQPYTIMSVSSKSDTANSRLFEVGAYPNRALDQVASGIYAGSFLSGSGISTTYPLEQMSMLFNSSLSQFWINGTSTASGSAGTNVIDGQVYLGSDYGGDSYYFTGTISEFIIYNTGLSTVNRQIVENNEQNNFFNTSPSSLTITSPARGVVSSPTMATTSYVDQGGNTVYIPYIQTSTTLTVAASIQASSVPTGGGVKFVLNQGLGSQQVVYDMASPYTRSQFTATFTGLTKGTYTLDVYVVDSSQVVVSGSTYHDSATDIGIGDIYVAMGDSITKGAGGISGSGCSASGTVNGAITNWTQSLPGTVSTDNRNYCQWSVQDPQYFKSYMPELNNELESYLGYPVFILNEGYGGYSAAGYGTNPMGLSTWQTRVSGLAPNKYLLMLGTNDISSTGTLVANMTAIVNTLESTYGATHSSVYIGLPPYDASKANVQTYIAPLQGMVSSLSLGVAPISIPISSTTQNCFIATTFIQTQQDTFRWHDSSPFYGCPAESCCKSKRRHGTSQLE